MRGSSIAGCVMLLLATVGAVGAAPEAGDQPWQKLYTGQEATGPGVIALWQFQPGQEAKDASGHGHDLTLRGESRFVAEGPLGGALESFLGGTGNDKKVGAQAKNHASLSPTGAFTLDLWFAAKPEMEQAANVFAIDKKYFNYARDDPRANWDYCLCLARAGEKKRRMLAHLGYGKDSATYTSEAFDAPAGEWIHLAFTYDGAGIGRFFVNGKPSGKTIHEGRGPVTPGQYDLVIGDRYGSTHTGFPGYLAQVRLSNGVVPYFTGSLEVDPGATRTAFLRMEKGAALSLAVSNDTGKPLTKGSVQVVFGGATRQIPLQDLAPNQEQKITIPVDTSLRPDTYPLAVTASASSPEREYRTEKSLPIAIVARPLPDQMPVVMWGGGDLPRLKEIGFTHNLIHLVDYGKVWEAGEPTEAMSAGAAAERARLLDEYLVNGFAGAVYVYPGRWVMTNEKLKEQFHRVERSGQPRGSHDICASFPEVQRFGYNVGASVAKTFGSFPALQASLVHSEIRDGTDLCFHQHDQDAYRRATGAEMPEVQSKGGIRFSAIRGFPARQVVPDDHPVLKFYQWFWKDGDGWNPLHTQVHNGLKSTGRKDLWTFFDPAVRVPSVWGSGGGVDIASQWTYSYPDAIKIGQATDELFAMADGRPGQQVMKMTQVIWYRTGTAPKLPEDESKRAPWEKEKPEARFITISPDHMREAFWSKLSRPIRGIMYHGWGSLVETGEMSGYCFTNPETQKVLGELTRTVVRPLGPTLLNVPDRKSDVALLESFASQVFAARGTHGWSGSWEADVHLILQWAQLQPRILYEETIRRDGLDGYRVLVMPFCDVLPESVAKKIVEFQRKGGIVVADECLTPALTPDIVLPSRKRTKRAHEDKAALQALAAQLRGDLDPFYTRYGEASDPDVVVRFRQYGQCDYLFAVNDKRTYGDYVGHHGLVMEKGLPHSAAITVRRPAGHVYDLVAHKAVPAKAAKGALQIDADFGPGDGRLYLISPAPIAEAKLAVPARAQLGKAVEIRVGVIDDQGKPLPAMVPVQVDVLDPEGRPAEPSGYYAAKDGRLSLTLDLASNDTPGRWTVKVQELASGKTATAAVTVAR